MLVWNVEKSQVEKSHGSDVCYQKTLERTYSKLNLHMKRSVQNEERGHRAVLLPLYLPCRHSLCGLLWCNSKRQY